MTNLAQLQKAIAGPPEKPPKDFRTRDGWEKKWRCSERVAQITINRAIKAGLWERIDLRALKGGIIQNGVPHYGPKRKAKRG